MRRSVAAAVAVILSLALSWWCDPGTAWGHPPAPAVLRGRQKVDRPALQRVLVLYSHDRLLPSSVILDEELRRSFRDNDAGLTVEYYSEFLDASRFPAGPHRARMADFLLDKYGSGVPPDLVIASGPQALLFLLDSPAGGRLFPNIPIVFCTVDARGPAGRLVADPPPGTTGVKIDVAGGVAPTLDVAARLTPDRRHVVLVAGTAPADRALLPRVRAAVEDYRRQRQGGAARLAAVSEIVGLPIEATERRLARLPPDALVLFVNFLRDGAGRPFAGTEAVERFSRSSGAPVYALYDNAVGAGGVAAVATTFRQQGAATGRLALRVLAGEPPESIPPTLLPRATHEILCCQAGSLAGSALKVRRLLSTPKAIINSFLMAAPTATMRDLPRATSP